MIFYRNNMTQEEIKFLSEYESNFQTAMKSNYTRNIVKRELLKMLDIYERETGNKYNLCTHCSNSVLGFVRLIGKLYFEKVQEGNETILKNNELDKTVTKLENNKSKKQNRNGKHTTG